MTQYTQVRTDTKFVRLESITDFIDKKVGETGRPVTVGEIAANFNISRQATFDRIQALRANGYLLPQARGVSGQMPSWAAEAVKAAFVARLAE